MPIRKILICVLTGMLCFGFFSPKAADAAQTPQEFVKEFYEWYIIKHYELDNVLTEEKLLDYVDETLIGYLKQKEVTSLYYFTQMGETMQFKDCSVLVKNALAMTGDVYVVPVIFKGKNFYNVVITYVKKLDRNIKLHPYPMPTHTKLEGNVYEKTSPYRRIFLHRITSTMPEISARARCGVFCAGFL